MRELLDLRVRYAAGDATRSRLFASLDAPAPRALPAQSWMWATWRMATVRIDCQVEIDAHRCSVPHALVGTKLQARVSDALILTRLRKLRLAGMAAAIEAIDTRPGRCTCVCRG